MLTDTTRCAWHTDPDNADAKTVKTLRDARASAEVKNETNWFGECLDGAVLRSLELGDDSLCVASLYGMST